MAAKRGRGNGTTRRRTRKGPTTIEGGADPATVGTGNKQANAKARKAQIRKAHKDISALEKQRDALRAQASAKGKAISAIFRHVKSDLEISRKNFEFQRELIELEDDARLRALDELKECYEALRPGDQLTMFADEPEQADEAPAARTGADLERVEAD